MEEPPIENDVTDSGLLAETESPRPTAFTIDFGDEKRVDTERHKALSEKFEQRHRRGKSMFKPEDTFLSSTKIVNKKHPLTGNLPRKSSFHSEGYFSSDEKNERSKSAKKSDLTLLLKNVTTDRMTQSLTNAALLTAVPLIRSPEECELQNVSSPEFELISPFSPSNELVEFTRKIRISSPESNLELLVLTNENEYDLDKKSDTISDAGTYTLEVDNYSEEQKARMSIDKEFKIESVSVQKKTEEYIKSLSSAKSFVEDEVASSIISLFSSSPSKCFISSNRSGNGMLPLKSSYSSVVPNKVLSPILSPTQNLSIVDKATPQSNDHQQLYNKTFMKTMFPNSRSEPSVIDQGAIISITSSGAFRLKTEEKKQLEKKLSLSKSEIHVEAYIDGKNLSKSYSNQNLNNKKTNLTANIVNMQSIEVGSKNSVDFGTVDNANLVLETISKESSSFLPSLPGGKTSPSKIPSPIHTLSRPRSRNNIYFSNDYMDTEMILKPTQNYISALQHKLSVDSDPDSDYEIKYGIQLNNSPHLLKQRASHIRHNSLDDRTINNKLEHFQTKNLQGIDQTTYGNLLNQYKQNKVVNSVANKINNSPSNSPIRRSSSFSNRNQIKTVPKSTNLETHFQKESNLKNSPNLSKNNSIQRSSSTACIKPNYILNRRSSISEHRKIDRSQFGDTESSSEEDFDKHLQRRKDLGSISNTRCNRTFSLRRARLDNDPTKQHCPNTPEMRRKLVPRESDKRAFSVDRKPIQTNEVQSRYLLNISKKGTPPPTPKDVLKSIPKSSSASPKTLSKTGLFSRTETGRFSMRTPKPPTPSNSAKSVKKDVKSAKKSNGARSNSSLSSREVEFQNWKRRKSYDPMKSAAEGKKKEIKKKLGGTSGSLTEGTDRTEVPSPDSSPSHSGSVHRSQSFHGTAALEQLVSSDEEDLTISVDEGFSPPTPSPCGLSPTRASVRHTLWERIHN